MGRRAGFHWDGREQAYRSDSGGRTRYFRGVARADHAGIAAAWSAYLAELDERSRPHEPDVWDLCVAFKAAARGVDARTRRTHGERLERFCCFPHTPKALKAGAADPPPFGDRKAAAMKAADLRAALRAWDEQGLSAHYRAGICRSVKAAFAWAATEGGGHLIPGNPLAEVVGPKVRKGPDQYAGRGEMAAYLRFAWRRAGRAKGDLYRHFGRRFARLVQFCLQTGCRPGEARLAEWHEFDEELRLVLLPAHKVKTRKPREIALPPSLVRALARERDRPGRVGTLIFPHKRGKGAGGRGVADPRAGEAWDGSALAQKIRKVRGEAIAAGVDLEAGGANRFTLYRLRHTSHARSLERGGTVAEVAALHGNSARTVEASYTGPQRAHLAEVAARLRARKKAGG